MTCISGVRHGDTLAEHMKGDVYLCGKEKENE